MIGITIKLKNNQELDVVSVYCPNGSQSNYEELETILNNTGNSAIVCGDLNAHSELWEDGYPTNTSGRNLKHYILNEDKFLLATPKNLGTRPSLTDNRSATIDLTLCTPNLARNTSIVTGPYWGSDHLPVIIEIQANTTLHTTPPSLTWKIAENKWQDWNDELGNSLKGINQRNLTPENVYNIFYTVLMESCNNFFAPKSATSPRESTKPWWTKECRIAKKMQGKLSRSGALPSYRMTKPT